MENTVKRLLILFTVLMILTALLTGCFNRTGFLNNNTDGKSTTGKANSTTGASTGQNKATKGPDTAAKGPDTDNSSSSSSSNGSSSNGSSSNGSNTGNVRNNIDLSIVKPDEDGKVMVVMFHNFIDTYKSGDKEFTTTFDAFRKLLQDLYDRGYRLISLTDYLNNDIPVAAGCIPIVFTFDDATSGQFNLVEENGRFEANTQSAVGIMEKFNKTHPDFGLKGTFYVNLAAGVFAGKGTVVQRLQYLIDKGFEIGNHTLNHVHLDKITGADKIRQEVGGNQKKMYELISGYKMASLSLPYGQPSDELFAYVVKGQFEGVEYENKAIMNVGWDPNVSPASRKFNPLAVHRVRATGITPVETDLDWWLGKLSRAGQYISDGNPETVTVPKAKETDIDVGKLNGKKLIVY